MDKRGGTFDSAVDKYWGDHTVAASPFKTADESARNLSWLYGDYPLSQELLGIWGTHDNQVILDYGCGPGNATTGFALFSRAGRVIGMDISEKALLLAKSRLELHGFTEDKISLILKSDSDPSIPLENNSVDFINCQGVLQHTSDPLAIMKEFSRVAKPGANCTIMVYNADSLYFHLYTAYEKIIVEKAFPGLTVHEAFSKNTDGENCPIARCYEPGEFLDLCRAAGFDAIYEGGYFARAELRALGKYRQTAISDEILDARHKDFLNQLVFDLRGYPMYKGKFAGVGGVYKLYKRHA